MTREQTHLANGGAYLNIGLLVGATQYVPVFTVAKTLRRHGAEFAYSTLRSSDDIEDTLVVELARPLTKRALFEIASDLNQEAIVQYAFTGGELVGPKAEAWGEFDPALFLLLDGRKLSEVAQ